MEVLHEISGAIIAITLVMTAVFVPVTFMPGPVGIFYRQFGITMATSIILSGVVALTLTPVLCAMILKHAHGKRKKRRTPLGVFLDAVRPRRRARSRAATPASCGAIVDRRARHLRDAGRSSASASSPSTRVLPPASSRARTRA